MPGKRRRRTKSATTFTSNCASICVPNAEKNSCKIPSARNRKSLRIQFQLASPSRNDYAARPEARGGTPEAAKGVVAAVLIHRPAFCIPSLIPPLGTVRIQPIVNLLGQHRLLLSCGQVPRPSGPRQWLPPNGSSGHKSTPDWNRLRPSPASGAEVARTL